MEEAFWSVAWPVLEPLAVALATAVGGWVLTKLPGPARDYLQANVHEKDVRLVVEAMARRALATSASGASPGVAAADLESYARHVLPEVLGKLQPTAEGLRTIALSALARAAAETAPATRPAAGPTPG